MKRTMVRNIFSVALITFIAGTAIGKSDKISWPRFSSEYGVCSHLLGSDFPYEKSLALMKEAGIGQVRFDFTWSILERPEGVWHFEKLDRIVAEAEKFGIQILPILCYGNSFANPVWEHLDKWSNYVHTVVSRYKGKFPTIEIWNEANGGGFWRSTRNNYGELLKTSYAAIKRVDPEINVAIGGLVYFGESYVEGLCEDGYGDYFDVVCNHPYRMPERISEGYDKLHKVLKKYGYGNKPVWCNEIGYPTHDPVKAPLLAEALKIANPDRIKWNVIYAGIPEYVDDPPLIAEGFKKLLPEGSTCVYAQPGTIASRLQRGDVDAVILPFDESYFYDDFVVIAEFVKRGGCVIDYGGFPFYVPKKKALNGGYEVCHKKIGDENPRKVLRIHVNAPWNGEDFPQGNVIMEPRIKTDDKPSEGGWTAARWLTDKWLLLDDEFIPLFSGKMKGKEYVGMAVYRYAGGKEGSAIVSTTSFWAPPPTSQRRQAALIARAAAICFMNRVQAFFPYELRAFESDPYWKEAHFGLTHCDGSPKLAYRAYKQFIKSRPSGSIMRRDLRWKDTACENGLYFPQWITPEKKSAGMIWIEKGIVSQIDFEFEGTPSFCDMFGNILPKDVIENNSKSEYKIKVTQDPVYFFNAVIKQPEKCK